MSWCAINELRSWFNSLFGLLATGGFALATPPPPPYEAVEEVPLPLRVATTRPSGVRTILMDCMAGQLPAETNVCDCCCIKGPPWRVSFRANSFNTTPLTAPVMAPFNNPEDKGCPRKYAPVPPKTLPKSAAPLINPPLPPGCGSPMSRSRRTWSGGRSVSGRRNEQASQELLDAEFCNVQRGQHQCSAPSDSSPTKSITSCCEAATAGAATCDTKATSSSDI
mmetsp:Transcript_4133/g.8349  ORF Transcript_4133/g.8349 Transcript_4133/m.8349 type:complete len:223 (-) Transcript_4133:447-1115(-)